MNNSTIKNSQQILALFRDMLNKVIEKYNSDELIADNAISGRVIKLDNQIL